jgi:hypothetical protein
VKVRLVEPQELLAEIVNEYAPDDPASGEPYFDPLELSKLWALGSRPTSPKEGMGGPRGELEIEVVTLESVGELPHVTIGRPLTLIGNCLVACSGHYRLIAPQRSQIGQSRKRFR